MNSSPLHRRLSKLFGGIVGARGGSTGTVSLAAYQQAASVGRWHRSSSLFVHRGLRPPVRAEVDSAPKAYVVGLAGPLDRTRRAGARWVSVYPIREPEDARYRPTTGRH